MQTEPPDQNTAPHIPTDRRALLAGIGGLAAGALLAGKANAGPLAPPPGPITPTPGPEPRTAVNATNTPGDALSTFRITQPGSYYLTGPITGEVGKSGIQVAAPGVTIDLMGFELRGVPSSLSGIHVPSTIDNLRVHNGSIRGWGLDGIDGHSANNALYAHLAVSSNGRDGISNGDACVIEHCSLRSNGSDGIQDFGGSVIRACTASLNTESGIRASGSVIVDCAVLLNGANGIYAAGSGASILRCSAVLNYGNGIQIQSNSTVIGNSCALNGFTPNNDGAGILVSAGRNRIEDNHCTGADRGIHVIGSTNIILGNTCASNTVNWNIAANNLYGPIIDRTAPASAPALGNAAPGTLGTTDPHANFSL